MKRSIFKFALIALSVAWVLSALSVSGFADEPAPHKVTDKATSTVDKEDDGGDRDDDSSDSALDRHEERQMKSFSRMMDKVAQVKSTDKPEDIVVPVVFFLFLISVILGSRYLREQTERRRLDILKMMVEKGQPVPEGVVRQILNSDRRSDPVDATSKRVRNGFGFTIVATGLLIYALTTHESHHGALIIGIVFLGLGIGNIAAQRHSAASSRHLPTSTPE